MVIVWALAGLITMRVKLEKATIRIRIKVKVLLMLLILALRSCLR